MQVWRERWARAGPGPARGPGPGPGPGRARSAGGEWAEPVRTFGAPRVLIMEPRVW